MAWLQQITGTGYLVCILVMVYKEFATVLTVNMCQLFTIAIARMCWCPLVG